ncbi:MAG: cell envelope biogenesis protein LolA [Rhodovulum sp.]|jgi:outer membrane lipoprotein-sorting protein|nr:cell envelope biogenesis protein LolA [Rhodovulum sp.]
MKLARRTFMAGLAALAARPAFAADMLSLDQISTYLNSFTTAQATFRQRNADGSVSTGRLFLKRPGRARFEYDPPNDALVLAGGGQVAIYDNRINQRPEQYPLKRTPLNLILERKVDLSRRSMVVGHSGNATQTSVVAQDPEHPEYGYIELIFENAPVRLAQWTIDNGAGQQTVVELSELETGVELGARMFNIVQETAERTGQ